MYGPQGLVVLALSSGGVADTEDLSTFLASTGVEFPVLLDADNTYEQYDNDGGISPYPIDVVLDADGTIVYLARTYEPEAMRAAVEAVLP